MKALIAILVATGAMFAMTGARAEAQGVHLGVTGVHVDVGRTNASFGYQPFYARVGHSYEPSPSSVWGTHRGYGSVHYLVQPRAYPGNYGHVQYPRPHHGYDSQGHIDYHH